MRWVGRRWKLWVPVFLACLVFATLAVAMSAGGAPPDRSIAFEMVRSAASVTANCVPDAQADVSVTSKGSVEVMNVKAEGLPPKTEFDLFVIQVPNAPFGLSWYQGDLETNGAGKANGTFVGRFSIETFIVAPGGGAAGAHPAPRRRQHQPGDPSGPHVPPRTVVQLRCRRGCRGLCEPSVTPFNGDHTAGPQVLSTQQFGATQGPLGQLGS